MIEDPNVTPSWYNQYRWYPNSPINAPWCEEVPQIPALDWRDPEWIEEINSEGVITGVVRISEIQKMHISQVFYLGDDVWCLSYRGAKSSQGGPLLHGSYDECLDKMYEITGQARPNSSDTPLDSSVPAAGLIQDDQHMVTYNDPYTGTQEA